MSDLYIIIFLPVVAGIILFAFPEKTKLLKGIIALIISAITFFFSIKLFSVSQQLVNLDLFSSIFTKGTLPWKIMQGANKFAAFNIDNLSKFITLIICFFGLVIVIYSIGYFHKTHKLKNYFPYFLITLGLSVGTVLTDNLLFFLTFWGILGFTLYKLIEGYDEESSTTAKKTLIMIGSSDGIMILGIGIIWKIYGTFTISELNIPTTSPILTIAFLSLLIGSFTKAGAFPFHTWIPDYTKYAPVPSSAFLPASLDKLLGIYFLTRICAHMFILNQWLTFILLLIGVMTLIFAVMMALIQQNYKKLLGYNAVSQVGYMVMGLGLGTPLGIAGGLFHMINHAIYKSGLFLAAGSVEKRTGKVNLDNLGGLSKAMPVTFISALICGIAMSGVPPLNAFASKWVIYQGIIDFGKEPGFVNQLWVVWLGLAVIGSALTVATFIKFISGIFLGRKKEHLSKVKEVGFMMWLPGISLAIICIGIGVFASTVILPEFIFPLTGKLEYIGIWNSSIVSVLILVSILLGIMIYFAGNIKNFRIEDSFIGGEKSQEETSFPVVEFYKTISNFRLFSFIYNRAEKKWFDIYEISKTITLNFSHWLSKAHTGILTSYAFWIFAGLVLMMIILITWK